VIVEQLGFLISAPSQPRSSRGVAVGSPRARFARGQGRDLELRVGVELLDQALSDRAGRSENTDSY